MKVVIIGSGNVATHITKALYAVNVQIVQVWSYHYKNALLLANQVKAQAIANLRDIDNEVDIYLIAVKDDAISEVVAQLNKFKGVVAHTSGSVDIDIFEDSYENYGVFYPLQTFSKIKEVSFATVPLCLEANTESALQSLTDLANRLSSNVVEVNSEKRKILHLAAVFACNFTNHLYVLANEILKVNQLEFDILRPLITETAAKIQNTLPLDVQTGPAIRNDNETLNKHKELLNKQPELLEIYKTLSESIKKNKII